MGLELKDKGIAAKRKDDCVNLAQTENAKDDVGEKVEDETKKGETVEGETENGKNDVGEKVKDDTEKGIENVRLVSRVQNIFRAVMLVGFLLAALCACELTETSEEKLKDLDYTVCDESRLPHELIDLINEKKEEPFKFTYRTKDYLYIVVGYGAQDRMDLNVVMKELYLTENAIFVDTELTTKENAKLDKGLVSYPWIAVKCELYDVQVNFK